MLCMTEPIHQTGKVNTMNFRFCVSKRIVEMHKKGVYGQALRKNVEPKTVLGDEIDNHFIGKPIGSTETMKQALDGVDYFVHCQKEMKYVTKIISTHGMLSVVPTHQTFRIVNGQRITFQYPEPISGHNRAKHWVDNHNNHRHDPIDLAETWQTKWWPNW
ncbi:hypothetical protein ACHAW6_012417 [Cyclotella cf. meneghiniana]